MFQTIEQGEKMKKTQLTLGVVTALLLTVSAANAQDYPAAYFQPKVIYSSEAAAPALATTTPCPQKAVQTEVDSKYPAANFQPKVIYSSQDSK